MKKLIFGAAILVSAFFAASCQQEMLDPQAEGTTMTYTVEVPDAIATKATGDGFTLHYEVYRQGDVTNLAKDPVYEGTRGFSGGKATVELEFVKDQEFTVLFWAQQGTPQAYDITDLREVSLETLVANDTTAEVFAGNDHVSDCKSDKNGNVVLVRPVAQLNIATTAESFTLGTEGSNTATVVPTTSEVVVNGLYGTYNVATGTAGTKASRTYTEYAVPGSDFKGTAYKLMATNYLGFIPQAGDNVEVKFTIYTEKDGNIEHTVSNVPVKANYQTNILGNLISATADYQVTLEDWADAGKDMEVLTDGLVKNINGDYEVSSVNGLAYAINNLFVDANGVANAKTFYVKPGPYDMAQQAINDITVTSGTLKVYDTEAVVTRSATTGSVIITGLKKALIKEVKEDATVFFSGIIVKDFKGADGAAALVQNNEGKVVLADCQILDENDAPDQDTKLVGGNDPVEVEKGEEEAGDLIYTAKQLAAAFEDESVESIALGADITLENTLVFPEGRTATLDLRGWELTIADPDKVATTYALNNHGTLRIKDSYATGEVNARGIYNGYVAEGDPISSAKLIVESGSFNAMGTNGGAAVFNYGQLEINGGKFTSVASYSVNTQAGGKVTVNGGEILGGMYNSGCEVVINKGKIEGNRSGCHTVYNYDANVTINGGTFHNNNSGNSTIMAAGTTTIKYNGGTYSIKDGRVEGNGNTWTSCLIDSQNTATSEITAGTFNGGFRVQAGTSMTITGGSFNDCSGSNYNIYGSVSITGGTYTDANAKAFATKYAHKDYKLVDETVVPKVYTVQIGEEKYETIQEAVDVVENEGTITLIENVSVTETSDPNGNVVYYTGDKSFTIDLNGKELKGNTSNVIFRFQKSEGAENTITIKNGTVEALQNSWSAISIGSSASTKTNVNLVDLTVKSQKANDMAVRARSGAEFTMTNCTVVATESAGGICAGGGNVTLNNVTVNQTGWYSNNWNSVALGLSGGAKMTINSGNYTSNPNGDAHGTWVAYVMSSGGILEINGGTFNGTVAQTANSANACGLICADAKSEVYINAGEFNSTGAILDIRNNTGGTPNPKAVLAGGTFSADPRTSGLYGSNLISVAEGYEVYKEADLWKVGEEGIRSWAEFTEALAADETEFKLQADITYDANYQLQKAVTIDLNEYALTLPMINIHSTATVKNGTINGKVYARKNSEVVFENITFSGNVSDNLSTEGHLAIQGGCKSIYAKDCLFSPTSVSGSQTKPLSFEGGSTQMKFENCEFKSSPYKKQVYLNSLSATGSLEFINCNFNNKTPNIMFAAACPLTNITMTGTTKLSSVTFEINRAKEAVTDADLAYLRTLIANNSFSSVRLFYAGGSSEYIR